MIINDRHYDPSTGRFLQQDPDPGRVIDPITINNKYSYVGNSPTNQRDPSGKDFLRDLGMVAVFAVALVSGAWIGAMAAGATITAALVGAAAGGAVGAVGFPLLGLGTSQEGFEVGAIAGGLGGLARGAGWLGDYSVSKYESGKLLSGIENGINSAIKRAASPGSQSPTFSFAIGTEFAGYLGAIEPYVIGIVGGLYLDSTVQSCAAGNCNIPVVNTPNWSF